MEWIDIAPVIVSINPYPLLVTMTFILQLIALQREISRQHGSVKDAEGAYLRNQTSTPSFSQIRFNPKINCVPAASISASLLTITLYNSHPGNRPQLLPLLILSLFASQSSANTAAEGSSLSTIVLSIEVSLSSVAILN